MMFRRSFMRVAQLACVCMVIIIGNSVGAAAASNNMEPTFGHYAPARQYSSKISNSIYLPMRDGTKLAVRIDRPAIDGKPVERRFPVIVQFALSIDNVVGRPAERMRDFSSVPRLTDYGYVVVQVARRGNGQSFGARRGYHDRNEAQDAFEVIEWLAVQPWSDGKIGTYGCSNTGDAALQAATVRPPHLKAVFAGCFNWDKFDGMLRGGILAQWGTGPTRTIEQDMRVNPVDGDEDKVLLRRAAEEHQLSPSLLEMWREMPYRDSWSSSVAGRFWAETSLRSYAEQIRLSGVALYLQTGWYNESRDQSFLTWANVPGARLIVGPWLHCLNGDFDLLAEMHRFFDENLKGIDTGLSHQQPIQYYLINGESGREWRSSASWPLSGERRHMFYLRSGMLADSAREAAPARFVAAPDDALDCEGRGGPMMQPCPLPGIGSSFRTEPLKTDMTIVGAPVVDLVIAADKPDANIFVYLEDVAPDGKITEITEGRLKASLRKTNPHPYAMDPAIPWHRAYREDAEPLIPNVPANLPIALTPIAYVLKAGHRLQLSVRGGDFRERNRPSESVAISILAEGGSESRLSVPVVGK